MTMNIKLQSGSGQVAFNTDEAPAAPEVVGFINFALETASGNATLHADVKAWIKRLREEAPYYSLCCLGWTGVLRKQTNPPRVDSPRYVGHLGPNKELQVLGWQVVQDDGRAYIRLELRESTTSNAATASVDGQPEI